MKPNLFQISCLVFLTLHTHLATPITHPPTNSANLLLPSDSTALFSFKSEADLGDKLRFSPNTSFAYCKWQGVKCRQARVVRLVLQGLGLGGVFGPDTLTRLDQLRVLSLQNNSLTGPIPDLAQLVNLKALFLDHNSFAGPVPNSITTLHRIRTIDLSFNNFTGSIPSSLNSLDRLYCLRLEWNRLTGSIPPLNHTSLLLLNLSRNHLTGAIPVTETLSRFGAASFSLNPGLCGEIVNRECHPPVPFFAPSPAVVPLGQGQQLEQGVGLARPSSKNHKRTAAIVGFTSGVFVLVGSIIFLAMAMKKHGNRKGSTLMIMASDSSTAANATAVMRIEEEKELEEKVKKVQGIQVAKSGSLVFCAGEPRIYSLDQLMRASAELLGKGTVGTTYKAVLENRLILTVKRLDAGKLAGTSREVFERHMESVGGLRHPNLVPLRAYFQAREERVLVYDYQPNGSLFSLIHGTKSARAKPLHWTSCLKIAEDVAQGLSYIHQAWRLVHGNLKSSNVLLGPDFEACLTDYSLSLLLSSSSDDDDPTTAYRAPETRKSSSNHHREPTSKSDVYAYGILLLELLTGKPPPESTNLCLIPDDMVNWVRSSREDHGGGGEDHRLEMLLEVAMACSVVSPEQRPTMWQVLKMIQEIKGAVILEDCERLVDPLTGTS